MRALIVKGYLISIADVDRHEIETLLGCAKGCAVTTDLRDGAVMYTDREAPNRRDSPHNAFASLVSGGQVYGPAIITGRDGTDVPESYIPMLEWNDMPI